MIKKNTNVVFEDEADGSANELMGGMPLSKGEVVHIHRDGDVVDYEVVKKETDLFLEGEDQTANTTYTFKRVSQ